MELDAAKRTHRGLIRSRNEDAACLCPRTEGPGPRGTLLAAVADGMGGHPGGDRASALVVGSLDGERWISGADPRSWLRAAFTRAGECVAQGARDDRSLAGMGTTLTAALFLPEGVWVASVGDSRLYWIRGGRSVLVTRDHTMASDLVRRGLLDEADADRHPSSHLLTRCLGTCADGTPDLSPGPLCPRPGDIFLLTSDGLGRGVAALRLPGLVEEKSSADAADALVDAALKGGAPDNVTVIVVRWLGESPAEHPGGVEFTTAEEWERGGGPGGEVG
jgi:PPM family protein phosphatase